MVETGSDNFLGKTNMKQSSSSHGDLQEISKSTLAPICDRMDVIESSIEKLETLLNSNVLLLQGIQTEVMSTKLSVLHLTETVLKDAVSRVKKNSSCKKEQGTGGNMNNEKNRKTIEALFPDAFIKDHPILSSILANPKSTYRTLREAYPNIPILPDQREDDNLDGLEEKWVPTLIYYIVKYSGASSNTQHTQVPAHQGIKSVIYAIVEYLAGQIEQFDRQTLAIVFIGLCSTILFLVFAYLNGIYFYEQQTILLKKEDQSIFDKIRFW